MLDIFLLARVVGMTLSPAKGSKEPPHPWDFYPELFEDEKAAYERKRAEGDMEKVREQRRAYAQKWNERYRMNHADIGDA